MKFYKIIDKLEEIVPINGTEEYPKTLIAGSRNDDIKKIGIALDFLSSTLRKAKKEGCDLLLVHHGPPNYESFDSEVTQNKIRLAKDLKLAVFSLSFCLDISPFSTTANIVKLLGIEANSVPIKFHGHTFHNGIFKLKNPISHKDLVDKLKAYPSSYLRIYGKTKEKYNDVVIAAGGGFQIELLEHLRPEVYISGDLNIRATRTAEELNIVLIELSHSSMENFPLKLTAMQLSKLLGFSVKYIKQTEPIIRQIK